MVTFKYVDNICVVSIDGIEYAVFQDCQRDDIDETKVVTWIDETCYFNDHLSSQYIPCELRKKDFAA